MPHETLPAWAQQIVALAPYQYHLIAGSLAVVIVLEWIAPRRAAPKNNIARWLGTMALALLGYALAMLVGPTLQAWFVTPLNQLGLPNLERLDLPLWASVTIALIILDGLAYVSHRLFHAVPLLWRTHQVHHSDPHMDATTGLLHHPLESLLTLALQLVVIGLLGLPMIAVLLYALLATAHNAFTHANLDLPEGVDRVLRWFIITPDMHRIHHSVEMDEGNSNFGAIMPWWDRAFGTYCAEPRGGQEAFPLGLQAPDASSAPGFVEQLLLPFRKRA